MKSNALRRGSRRVLGAITILGLSAAVGCFQWTEDSQGNLQSVGVPGVPLWQSKATPAPMTPADLGIPPDEAAKMSGLVLVEPPDNSSHAWRYRYYETGQNNCQADLQKMLEERAQLGIGGTEPYCTEHPTQPTAKAPGIGL
jgi:hypothetical protein